jgi:hypothetical protein
MPFTNDAEAAILDAIFDLFGDEGSLWVGLSSTTPGGDGSNITEPTGGSYARAQVDTDDFAAAVGGAPTTKASDAAITFPKATADWVGGANLTHWVLYDASTSGDPVAFGAITTPKPVLEDDTPSFGAGDLVFRLGAPADFE